MKFVYTVGIVVMLGIAAAWWFSESEDQATAIPGPAVSSGFDARQQMRGNVESTQKQGTGEPVAASRESTAGQDAGSDGAMAAPAGEVPLLKPGVEQVALRNAVETIPGQPADTKSSQPSAIDKTDCETAARTLDKSLTIFDVAPTKAYQYAWSPPYPNAGLTGFEYLRARLLAPLCTGTIAFDPASAVRMEFVAISIDSHVRILVGDYWISDGTVLSPLSDEEQESLSNAIQRRRNGPGPDRSREIFERQLAQDPRSLIPASIRNAEAY
jgi:hypothetical protein